MQVDSKQREERLIALSKAFQVPQASLELEAAGGREGGGFTACCSSPHTSQELHAGDDRPL